MTPSSMQGMSQDPNTSIHCTVSNCTHHCQDGQYCSLPSVRIGTHDNCPSNCQCVDCESFQAK